MLCLAGQAASTAVVSIVIVVAASVQGSFALIVKTVVAKPGADG